VIKLLRDSFSIHSEDEIDLEDIDAITVKCHSCGYIIFYDISNRKDRPNTDIWDYIQRTLESVGFKYVLERRQLSIVMCPTCAREHDSVKYLFKSTCPHELLSFGGDVHNRTNLECRKYYNSEKNKDVRECKKYENRMECWAIYGYYNNDYSTKTCKN
jgi:hypothetical protein